MTTVAYTRGLHELGDGLFAYLQPDGGWGWSNAGLITAEGTSLLVDTLFDLNLTRDMLDAMKAVHRRAARSARRSTPTETVTTGTGTSCCPDNIPIVASAGARSR